ncbi:3809_t:CDS:1, partial [Scutellospora calospora]
NISVAAQASILSLILSKSFLIAALMLCSNVCQSSSRNHTHADYVASTN